MRKRNALSATVGLLFLNWVENRLMVSLMRQIHSRIKWSLSLNSPVCVVKPLLNLKFCQVLELFHEFCVLYVPSLSFVSVLCHVFVHFYVCFTHKKNQEIITRNTVVNFNSIGVEKSLSGWNYCLLKCKCLVGFQSSTGDWCYYRYMITLNKL